MEIADSAGTTDGDASNGNGIGSRSGYILNSGGWPRRVKGVPRVHQIPVGVLGAVVVIPGGLNFSIYHRFPWFSCWRSPSSTSMVSIGVLKV